MLIQSGTLRAGKDDPQWELDRTSPADRTYRQEVRFPQPFGGIPTVVVSLANVDFPEQAAQKISVSAGHTTEALTTVVIHTWDGCVVARAGVSWIAYGPPVPDDDET